MMLVASLNKFDANSISALKKEKCTLSFAERASKWVLLLQDNSRRP
jgi:hypothetical protein